MDLDRLLSMWWESGKPEQEYAGEISRDEDGAVTVQLIGTVSGNPFSINDPEPAVLHGVGNQGPLFTARRLIRAGIRMGAPGFPSEVFRPLSLIVGGHVDESTVYDEGILQLTFLGDWLQESGIRLDVVEGGAERRSAAVRYEWPEVRTANVADGVTVSTWSGHQAISSRSGFTIREDVALKISLRTATPVDDLIRDYVNPLIDLVSFATGRGNAVDRLVIQSPSVTRAIEASVHREDLEFLTEWIVKKPKKDPERLMTHHMKFALGDAAMGFDALVRRWYELHTRQRLSLAPYFALLYAPPTYVDLKLVSISQALEAYHRASGLPRAAMSSEEFKAFKKALLDACPSQHQAFLREKLGYLNEVTQVSRTLQLIERARTVLRRLFESRPNFAYGFIGARNIKTHPEEGRPAFSGTAVYDLVAVATFLFEANVLLDLGFDEVQAGALFERQPEYAHLVSNPPRHEHARGCR